MHTLSLFPASLLAFLTTVPGAAPAPAPALGPTPAPGFAEWSVPRPVAPLESAARLQLDDATIVAIFDQANTADIETSSLAAKKAVNADVKELGRTFAHDHEAVRTQGRELAKKLGITPTPLKDDKSAREQAEVMRTLRAAKGEDFDRLYLAHEVAYHEAVIKAINETLLPATKNPELKAFIQKVAPAFQGHLAAAQKLATKYGASKA
jgi:putative membrane protein